MLFTASIDSSSLPQVDLVSFRVSEGLSRLFQVDVELVSDDPDIDLDALLWSTALVELHDDRGASRYFHGVIEEAEYCLARGKRFFYRVRLHPVLHGLDRRIRTRIFQGKDVVEIIKTVCRDSGVPDDALDWSAVKGPYPKREFCMQYKESELAFILRLLEDEGIFFWFEHGTNGHIMRLAESPEAYHPISGSPHLSAFRRDASIHVEGEILHDLQLTTRLGHEVVMARDWDWHQPRKPVQAEADGDAGTGFIAYEYPGGFTDPTAGGSLTRQRLDEARAEKFLLEGRTNSYRLVPSKTFTLSDAVPDYLCNDYVVLDVVHEYRQRAYAAEGGDGDKQPYWASFRAVPSSTTFRPPRRTPRPRVYGIESAVVTGPEEIHVDSFGRIKVHFYFDREGAVDENASCWLRVQQQNTSGGMILPRRGWEVSVAFLDGDPDRPIVLQKLYNAETMPPYGLPANKTQSSLQTSTSPGGGSSNEIRMQDGNGGMEFALHSSKDFKMVAGNNLVETIAVDAHEEVGVGLSCNVGGSETVTVGATQAISVTQDCSMQTNGSRTISIGAVDDLGVTGNVAYSCDGSRTESIAGLMNVLANSVSETFDADVSRTVAAAQSIASATVIIDAVGGAKSELVGAAKLEILGKSKAETVSGPKTLIAGFMTEKTGKDVGYSAKAAVTFQVGGAIAEKCGGDFNCTGKVILITAAGGIKIDGGGTPYVLKGADIKVDAGAMSIDGGAKLKLDGSVNYKP